jgi:hypothetical protein
MTQPAPQIPGLITTAGTTVQPQPQAAQPGAQLPPGTLTPGALPPAPQIPTNQPPAAPALPQAGASLLPPPPQVDPAAIAAYQAYLTGQATAAVQTPDPTVAPQQPAAPAVPAAPVLPTSIPNLAPQQVAVPGLTAPVTLPPAQPAAPAAPAQPAAPAATDENEPSYNGLDDGDGKSYPKGKPLADMNPEERAEYHKWYSRQWENRAKSSRTEIEQLKQQLQQVQSGQQTTPVQAPAANDLEQRLAAARDEGIAMASAAAAVVLVDAHVRAGLQNRLAPEQIEVLASNLAHTHFLSADGRSVDAAKVATFVNSVAPAPATPADPAVPAATAPAAPAVPGSLPTSVLPGQPVTGLPRPDLGQGSQPAAPLDKLTLGKQQAQAFLAGNL